MAGSPAATHSRDVELDTPLRCELEGVGQQVLENLLEPLGVGAEARPETWIHDGLEQQLPGLGLMAKRTRNRRYDIREVDFFGFDRDGSRLDLRQVENVADQVQKIASRAVNGAGKLHLP